MTPQVPNVPELGWLDEVGDATWVAGSLTMSAGPATDWFNDPTGSARTANAPVLVTSASGELQLAARVRVGFESTFDAGVLFVHQGPEDYAKLCFERSPHGENLVVSVVTREVSDDANGRPVPGDEVWLRVSLFAGAVAFHSSFDGAWWDLARIFRFRDPSRPTSIGFCAQSPTGAGCSARFADVAMTPTRLRDSRDGS